MEISSTIDLDWSIKKRKQDGLSRLISALYDIDYLRLPKWVS
jgi:hypothetical protein